MRIVLDLQGCQTVSRLRGIGRYSLALAHALIRNKGEHDIYVALNDLFPPTVDQIRKSFRAMLPEDHIRVFTVPPLPQNCDVSTWRVQAAELVREHAIAELQPDLIHIGSLFEGYSDNAVESIHALNNDVITAVTLYDLIPYRDPATHLTDVGRRQYYLRRIEDLKRADLLLAISEYCAQDATEALAIEPRRIVNISSAADPALQRLAAQASDEASVLARLGIVRPFVMTTGIVEPRKNLDRLIEAYARLPHDLRRAHQLLAVCQPTAKDRERLYALAADHGMATDELLLLDFVQDAELALLYGRCRLFVFPSLQEGFGLPALEAMTCGAIVIGSNATSVPEVIGHPEALFDPVEVSDITAKMARGLTDEAFRVTLQHHHRAQAQLFSWDHSAQRALAAFDDIYARRHRAQTAPREIEGEARYKALIHALGRLEGAPSELDLLAVANAVALNRHVSRLPQLLIDVSTLANFDAKSGIQRVTRSIVHHLLVTPPDGWEVRLVRLDLTHMAYRYADQFAQSFVGSEDIDLTHDDDWVDTQPGDHFVGLDLVADRIPALRSWLEQQHRRQVKISFVIYDVLPVLHPEWFDIGMSNCFPIWLETIASVSDQLICISQAVADDLAQWLDRQTIERTVPLEIGYFHLGADIHNSVPSSGIDEQTRTTLALMGTRPSILMVGTVEPRKGHRQSLAAFEQLWARQIDVNLVIVGKAGWGLDAWCQTLQAHPEMGRHLFWLRSTSDEALEQLYRTSACLLAASEGEGFGLPLIEAAQHALPVIARDLPVFREVAGEHAYFFSGAAPAALAEAIETWLALAAQGAAPTSSGLPWLTWEQSAAQLQAVLFGRRGYRSWLPAETHAFRLTA